jgi:hypothetical protein
MLARHLLPWLVLISAVTGYAQTLNNAHPVAGQSNPSLDRRIELLIRSQFSVRPDFDMTLGARTASDTAGFESLPVTFSHKANRRPSTFLSPPEAANPEAPAGTGVHGP